MRRVKKGRDITGTGRKVPIMIPIGILIRLLGLAVLVLLLWKADRISAATIQDVKTPATLGGEKKAEAVDDDTYEDLYRIDLDISGTRQVDTVDEAVPVDIVLAIDLSNSVDYNNRWGPAKRALNQIISALLEETNGSGVLPDIRVGMVGFGSGQYALIADEARQQKAHKVLHTLSSDPASLRSVYQNTTTVSQLYPASIGGVQIAGGTNSEAGFIAALQMLEGRTDEEKTDRMGMVVFLTDGETTYGYREADLENDYFLEELSTDDTKVLARAQQIKDMGYTIYSVGLDLAPNSVGRPLLEQAASEVIETGEDGTPVTRKLVYYTNSSQLDAVFYEIGHAIRQTLVELEHGSVTLVDNMSPYVSAISAPGREAVLTYSTDGGATYAALPADQGGITYDETGDGCYSVTISAFNSDYLYRFTYYIQVKPEAAGQALHKDQTSGADPEAGEDGVVANGYTYLTSDRTDEVEVLVPTVHKPFVGLAFFFYKVDGATETHKGLAGAAFMLYRCEDSIRPDHVHAADMSCFTAVLTEPVESDADGVVDLSTLSNGAYLLEETKAAFGYDRARGRWMLVVGTDGSLTITAREEGGAMPPAFIQYEDGSFALPNCPLIRLPLTGGVGTHILYLIGILSLMAALIIRIRRPVRKTLTKQAQKRGNHK